MPDGPPVHVLDVTAAPDDEVPADDYLVLKVAGHSRGVAVDVVRAAGKEGAERAAAVRGDAVLAAIAGVADVAAAGDHVGVAAGMVEEACLHGRPDAAGYQADMLRQAAADVRVARECLAAAARRACFGGDAASLRLSTVAAAVGRAAAAVGRAIAMCKEKSIHVVTI